MKKGIAAAMAVLLAGVSAGCSGGGSGSSTGTDPGKETAPAGKQGGPTTLTMLVGAQGNWTYNKDKPIWKTIKEKTNVDIVGQVPPGDNYVEAVNLTVATGNMPDLMYMSSFTVANKYGQQGALANILDYLDLMPNFRSWLAKYPELKQRYTSAEGKMYMFPNEGFGQGERIGWMYRDDVFKKHNLPLPTTYDELYETLKKLKQQYPDSYPFVTRGAFGTITRMAPQFDTYNDVYYDFDKKEWRYGPAEDNYKKLVLFLNKLYKEGLMPPDWLTVKGKQFDDFIANNKAFVFLDYMVMDYYNVPLRKDNPQFAMLFMPPPVGFAGAKRQNLNINTVDSGMTVASTSSKIKDAMKYIDFFYSEAGKELSSWGIKGVTYEETNGTKKYLDEFKTLSDLREKPGLLNYGTYTWIDYNALLTTTSKETRDAYAVVGQYDSKLQPKPAFNEKENDVLTTVGQAIQKHREENITRFILGEKGMDQWDAYVADVKKLGLDQLVKVYKEAYDRQLQAK
ncbi:extracellular solute-binding protein [Paenibacillus hodogayensis]|uniref:Extracellular solute-binding protein n=1 Tax=Paenibacillus hodogayensis TaxID=279208 RepID=A0ABV5VZ51_9BACL